MPCVPGQPRDRVVIKRTTTYLAKGRPDVVEMEELEKYRSGPIDTEVLSAFSPGVRVLTRSAEDVWR